MAVPKRRKSPSKSAMGQAHKGVREVKTIACPNCGATTLPHRVCAACGYYQKRFYLAEETD